MEDSKCYSMEMTNAENNNLTTSQKKKHNMVLNFENKNSVIFGADQTPTPTRFIRNCEEVGLFQDLQNVNPFEETFKKAVESGKTGSTALQNCRLSTQVVTDDTLHTPHVFPHIIENDSLSKPDLSLKNKTGNELGQLDRSSTPTETVVRQEADTSQLKQLAPKAAQPAQIILEMPDGRLMQLNVTPLQRSQRSADSMAGVKKSKLNMESVILHTSPNKKLNVDVSSNTKAKLKARLGALGGNSQTTKQGKSGDQKLVKKEEGMRNKQLSPNSDDEENIKRQRFLERNRAAAMRCREKRKFWVSSLERRAEQLMTNNQQLQVELMALRTEVAQLKILLLAHKDCSVTRAMCNNSIITNPIVTKPVDHCIKDVSTDETELQVVQVVREDLMNLKSGSVQKYNMQNTSKRNINGEVTKSKRLSLDIETAKQSPPLIGTDEYLSSTYLPNESLELESFKPVATQVIQVNPNILNRRLSSPNIEGSLLAISPNTDSLEYS